MPLLNSSHQSLFLPLAAGICIFAIVYMVGKLIFTNSHLNARLNEIRLTYGLGSSLNLRNYLERQLWIQKRKKEKKKTDLKERILSMVLNDSFLGQQNLKLSFEQAGWALKDGQTVFLGSKILSLILGLAVGYIIIHTRTYFAQTIFPIKGVIFCFMAFIGWIVPNLYLKGAIKKRVELIEKQFPDALDLMIICMQASLGLNRTVERVGKEMVMFGKEIAGELATTAIELEIMLDRRQALQNLYLRIPSPIIRSFSTTVLQSIQQGTPTLHALDALSKDIREIRMQKAETKAAKLPSIMVIPLVLFMMPNIFILLLGPAIVKVVNVS